MKRIATISIGIGNIEIGNTSTLATFNKDLGHKCFGFTKMDAGAIRGIPPSCACQLTGVWRFPTFSGMKKATPQ